jgi:hypothetical protein
MTDRYWQQKTLVGYTALPYGFPTKFISQYTLFTDNKDRIVSELHAVT